MAITYCEKGCSSATLSGRKENPPVPAQPKVATRLKNSLSPS